MCIATLCVRTPKENNPKLAKIHSNLLSCYNKEGTLLRETTEDGFTTYVFSMTNPKPKKHKPLGYTPVNALATVSEHKPYYSWRVDTAAACTCIEKRQAKDWRGRLVDVAPNACYSTDPAGHASWCKAQCVIQQLANT